jgi:hypothetical protein
MKPILFLSHPEHACGVFQFGRRVFELASQSNKLEFTYREMLTRKDYMNIYSQYNPEYIIYNWHRGTMPALTESLIQEKKVTKHYFIFHDEFTRQYYDKYLFFGDYDFSGGAKFGEKKVLLPRPLMEYDGEYRENEVVNIGSFGFGFWNKGYHTLTELVNRTFDKAILNFHIPRSAFGDPLDTQTNQVIAECRRLNTNPNVQLNITRNLLPTEEVLEFLAGNDINVFMYQENGEGISSVIDYALSVKRPIAISNSRMFRHIPIENILLESNSIQDILERGIKPLEPYYEKWKPQNFIKEMEDIFDVN